MWPDWNGEFFRLAASTSLRATFLAAAVGGLLAAMRVPRGGVRHAAWAAVVAAMMLMPVLTGIVPPIELQLPVAARAVEPLAEGVVAGAVPDAALAVDAPSSTPTQEPPIAVTANETAAAQPIQALAGQSRTPGWPLVAIGVYAAGVLFFLVRLVAGWMMMRRLVRASRPWERPALDGSRLPVCESSLVATPLTVGLVSPRIILPSAWSSWPDEKLRAVLAHEMAHVHRRDPLVALVAFVNRAVFWFNPLAWWLERTLARNAEDACDGAAIKAVSTPRRYAEVLMEMAEAVSRSQGRVAWQGVGVDGTGLLGPRIDRILRGDLFGEVSMIRKVVISVVCVLAVSLAIACQQPRPAAAPLEPDPQLTAQWEKGKANTADFNASLKMTAPQVTELEAVLQKNPGDSATRKKLLMFYCYGDPKHTALGWNEKVAAKRRHILWVIANDPAGSLLDAWRTINPGYDQAGFAQAKTLWLEVTSKKDVATAVLSNAAYFFSQTDSRLVEQFLKRAEAQDPGGPKPAVKGDVYYASWMSRLGGTYASAIAAVVLREPTPAATGAASNDDDAVFAADARKKLEETSDVNMLVGAGQTLTNGRLHRGRWDSPTAADLELEQLGASYLNRVIHLDPSKTSARSMLLQLASRERSRKLIVALKDVPLAKQAAFFLALPEAERMIALTERAGGRMIHADFLEFTKHDPTAAKSEWALARTYADELLKLADTLPNDPNRGTAIFAAHVTLANLELRDNNLASALKHMEAAGNAPSSEELKYGSRFDWSRLAVQMLKWGERESVATFLERFASISESQRERLTKDAAQIRAGKMPAFYQTQTVPH